MNLMNRRPRRWLNKKELATIKYQSVDDWLSQGNEVTVLKPHTPEDRVYTVNKSKSKNKRRGISK